MTEAPWKRVEPGEGSYLESLLSLQIMVQTIANCQSHSHLHFLFKTIEGELRQEQLRFSYIQELFPCPDGLGNPAQTPSTAHWARSSLYVTFTLSLSHKEEDLTSSVDAAEWKLRGLECGKKATR